MNPYSGAKYSDTSQKLLNKYPNASTVHDNGMDTIIYWKLVRKDSYDVVKAAVIEQLPDGGVSDIRVAEGLNMSSRTLQRELNEKTARLSTPLSRVHGSTSII
jgi:hypothetical protein